MGSNQRNIYTQNQFLERQSVLQIHNANLKWLKQCNYKKYLLDAFPIIQWLSEYRIRRDLPMDIIAGITVTVLQIPQGIAYGFLANVPAVCGLYTAFYTSFIYVIFGTSRHLNLGTFAVVCLMTGEAVDNYSILDENGNELNQHRDATKIGGTYRNIEVLSTICFMVSIYFILMHIFRLGVLASILSQTLTNAFTSASSIHLIASQLKDLFGLTLKRRPHNYFKIGFTIYDISRNIPKTNYMAVVISSIALVILIPYNEIVKPWLAKRSRIPIPIELIVVALGILVSYLLDLNGRFKLPLIGDIPTGLPPAMLPKFELLPTIAFECIPIALVSYVVTTSLGLIFGRMGSYEIRPNQELLALGLMDLLGSFFQCVPVCGSLSRTIVQYHVGGASELTILFSSILVLLVLLYIAPIMEILPRCILAAIIISSIYRMLCQIRELKKFWLLSKLDAMIWIVTFLGTTIIDIKYGLLLGIASAIFVICYHFFRPNSYILGIVPRTEIYMSRYRYKEVEEIEGIKIFRYEGGINFATINVYRSHLASKTGIDAKEIINSRKRLSLNLNPGETLPELELPVKYIILDLSAVNHVDPAGIELLNNIENDYKVIGITILICSASGEICEKLANYDFVEKKGHSFTIFVSIHDAVLFAKNNAE